MPIPLAEALRKVDLDPWHHLRALKNATTAFFNRLLLQRF